MCKCEAGSWKIAQNDECLLSFDFTTKPERVGGGAAKPRAEEIAQTPGSLRLFVAAALFVHHRIAQGTNPFNRHFDDITVLHWADPLRCAGGDQISWQQGAELGNVKENAI